MLQPKFGKWVYQRPVTISESIPGCQTPVRKLQHPPKPQIRTQRTWMIIAHSKSRQRAKIWSRGEPKTSDHIQINIRIQNSSQEPPASSKAQNRDLKNMDVLCTFKIKIESQNSEYGTPLKTFSNLRLIIAKLSLQQFAITSSSRGCQHLRGTLEL